MVLVTALKIAIQNPISFGLLLHDPPGVNMSASAWIMVSTIEILLIFLLANIFMIKLSVSL